MMLQIIPAPAKFKKEATFLLAQLLLASRISILNWECFVPKLSGRNAGATTPENR